MFLALKMEEEAMSQGIWQPPEAENGLQFKQSWEWEPWPHRCKELNSCPVPHVLLTPAGRQPEGVGNSFSPRTSRKE